jgi:hypothetical protein
MAEIPQNVRGAAKTLLAMVLGSLGFFGLTFLAGPVGSAIGGDQADKGITTGVIGLTLWLGAFLLAVRAAWLCFIQWRSLRTSMRMLAFLPIGTCVAAILLTTFGPPKVDLVVSYVGKRDSMIIGTTTHFGEEWTKRQRGKPALVSSGQLRLTHIRVTWRESVQAEEHEQVIDLSGQIPRIGGSRTILILVADGGVTCEAWAIFSRAVDVPGSEK